MTIVPFNSDRSPSTDKVRRAFRASVEAERANDTLDLFGTLGDAAAHIRAASTSVLAAYNDRRLPTNVELETAVSAARRIIAAVGEFRRVETPASGNMGG